MEPGRVNPDAAPQQAIMAFKRSVATCRIVMCSETFLFKAFSADAERCFKKWARDRCYHPPVLQCTQSLHKTLTRGSEQRGAEQPRNSPSALPVTVKLQINYLENGSGFVQVKRVRRDVTFHFLSLLNIES